MLYLSFKSYDKSSFLKKIDSEWNSIRYIIIINNTILFSGDKNFEIFNN